ncbi:MAG TPA: acyl-CoA dehydrogenase family protein [Jatrophihabitans sp.]|nr:acyl-CoA dehydrogenase family protein [Jatrophihabitans sp.]
MSLATRFAELCRLELPLPGAGRTVERWRALAGIATEDLALVKLAESHFDALAILAELGAGELHRPGQRWAVWAAEPPDARLALGRAATGRKAWCSGADLVTHALVTGWTLDNQQQLAAITLAEAGARPDDSAWRAVGMGRVHTPDLFFDAVPFTPVGAPGQYVDRPGFWHGGAGIAACWYGGAVALAKAVAAKAARSDEPHLRAHLGEIDVALRGLQALLRETAAGIDAQPDLIDSTAVLRVRAAADQACRQVSDAAARALGAGPLCRDAGVAQHFADLAVFIRQTHAERDLAELAAGLIERGTGWVL